MTLTSPKMTFVKIPKTKEFLIVPFWCNNYPQHLKPTYCEGERVSTKFKNNELVYELAKVPTVTHRLNNGQNVSQAEEDT